MVHNNIPSWSHLNKKVVRYEIKKIPCLTSKAGRKKCSKFLKVYWVTIFVHILEKCHAKFSIFCSHNNEIIGYVRVTQ